MVDVGAELLLDARGATLHAWERRLLVGLDLSLSRGELVAVVGPSGCGKTSLLRALCGLSGGLGGGLTYRGAPAGQGGWPEYRRQVLLVMQQPALLEDSVEANLARPFAYHAAASSFSREGAAMLCQTLGLPDGVLALPARELSVGQQQRVCLVRALLLEPAVLLLDEPTSALDGTSRRAVEREIRERADGGMAGLVVCHDRELAESWCDRILDLAPYAVPPVGGGAP